MNEVTRARRRVLERCGGLCECCGEWMGPVWACHHRKLRSQGGDWSLPNLLALLPACHNMSSGSVHDQPSASYERGYLVHGAADPESEPVLLHGVRRVLLTMSGGYENYVEEESRDV